MTTHGLRRLICVGLVLPGLALATPPTVPAIPAPTLQGDTLRIEAKGVAPTRDEAIATALAQAVIQVQGRNVPFDVLKKMFLSSLREERMVRMNVMNDNRIRATRISTAVAFIQDYQVSESTRAEEGGSWEVRVTADVVSPEARLARRREAVQVAVLPFAYMQEGEGETGPASAQAAMKQKLVDIAAFRHQLESRLGQQPRVRLRALSAEQDGKLEAAADAPGQVDWPALSQGSGATSFITVQVEEFRIEAVKLKGNITTARLDGGYTFHYRLIRDNRGHAEVARSGTFTIDTRSPYLRPLAMTESNAPATPEQVRQRIAAVQAKVAQLLANTILGEMVLPQVVAREGDSVVLQAGASQLRPGDQVAVLGPDITTPDTGTGMLRREDGMRIAVLEVTAQEADRLTARIVKGNAFAVQPGSLLRRIGAGSSGVAAAALPAAETAAKPAAPKR